MLAGHGQQFVMKHINAKKVNMTQVWTAEGKVVPVTVLRTVGQITDLEPGQVIKISGKSKGRGWAGAVKRHGFHGAPASHGHDHPRAVGSIGNRFPQHTRPGMRMAGRMGGKNATVKNSVVVSIDQENHLLVVKGGVPGHPEADVKIVATGEVKPAFEIVKYVKEAPKAEAGTPAPTPTENVGEEKSAKEAKQ